MKKALIIAALGSFAVAAQAQTVVWSDTYIGDLAVGTSETAGYSNLTPLTGIPGGYPTGAPAPGAYQGVSGLEFQANFPVAYSGSIGVQGGYYGGNGNPDYPTVPTDPNLNDYTLSFMMSIPSGITVQSIQFNLQAWAGLYYTGAETQLAPNYNEAIPTEFVTVGTGPQLVSVNLGAYNTEFGGNFNPESVTYQPQWQLNGWTLDAATAVDEDVVISDAEITVVPEPSSLGLISLGLAGVMGWLRRRNA